jgi:hypothetical protein
VPVDTDFLLNCATAKVKGGERAHFFDAIMTGSNRPFASRLTESELRWNYIKASRRGGVDPETVRSVLNTDLVPFLHIVELGQNDPRCDRRLARVAREDPNDLNTANLADLLAPCFVLSEDRHLRGPGFAPATQAELSTVVAAGLQVSISNDMIIASLVASRLGTTAVGSAARGIAVRLKLPTWVVGLFGVAVVGLMTAWVLSSPERREKTKKVVTAATDVMARLAEERYGAQAVLDAAQFQPETQRTAANAVARLLSTSAHPLLATEIHHALYADTDTTVSDVLQFLRRHPSFVCIQGNRWQVGRPCREIPPSAKGTVSMTRC